MRFCDFRKEKLLTVTVNGSHPAACRRVDAGSPGPARRETRCPPGISAALAAGYDAWAPDYEADMARSGYRLPERMVDVVRRHIEDRRARLLDVGAGSGLLGKALKTAGYDNLVGLDPSPGMLRQAAAKRVYKRQLEMALGAAALRTGMRFDAALAAGVFKAGHAPPGALACLLRLVRPGGIIIFNLNVGAGAVPYDGMARRLAADRQWRLLQSTTTISFSAEGAPASLTVIHVFQTISAC